MESNAVYRFYNEAGALLYVGCSCDPFRRLREHELAKVNIGDVRGMTIQWYDSLGQAANAEDEAIEVEKPLWNVANNPLRSANARRRIARRGAKAKAARDAAKVLLASIQSEDIRNAPD